MKYIEKILRYMKAEGLTQTDLASRLDISISGLSDSLKKPDTKPTLPIAQKVAKLLGGTVDWLLDESTGYPPPPAGDTGTHLSDAERTVLDLARWVSRFDPDPSALAKARDLLTGGDVSKALELAMRAGGAVPRAGDGTIRGTLGPPKSDRDGGEGEGNKGRKRSS